jgi:muramoyltetrapeptide carboxypeptidase LdcA involved in peptidoglycan recycling
MVTINTSISKFKNLIHDLENNGAFQQQSGICIGIQFAELGFEAFPLI